MGPNSGHFIPEEQTSFYNKSLNNSDSGGHYSRLYILEIKEDLSGCQVILVLINLRNKNFRIY